MMNKMYWMPMNLYHENYEGQIALVQFQNYSLPIIAYHSSNAWYKAERNDVISNSCEAKGFIPIYSILSVGQYLADEKAARVSNNASDETSHRLLTDEGQTSSVPLYEQCRNYITIRRSQLMTLMHQDPSDKQIVGAFDAYNEMIALMQISDTEP